MRCSGAQLAAWADAAIPEELLQRWVEGPVRVDISFQRACLEAVISGLCSWMMVAFWMADGRFLARWSREVLIRWSIMLASWDRRAGRVLRIWDS